MKKEISALLNEQITKEFYSAYLYLAISAYYQEAGLTGFASWYEVQAKEEEEHAMKIYGYLHDNGETVELGALDAPKVSFSDFVEPVKAALEHEEYITDAINNIVAAAIKANDYRTVSFLQWFVDEQAEEETNANDMLQAVEFVQDDKAAFFSLNKSVGKRND
ncbi:ferritin [Pseudoramibacter alactolyticus]|jgi:ferritin